MQNDVEVALRSRDRREDVKEGDEQSKRSRGGDETGRTGGGREGIKAGGQRERLRRRGSETVIRGEGGTEDWRRPDLRLLVNQIFLRLKQSSQVGPKACKLRSHVLQL